MSLRLVVNGDPVEAPEGSTVRALVEQLGLGTGPVAVERNGGGGPRRGTATTALAEGDRIGIVHFVGGG